MRALGKWSIKNHVTVNLIMVFILIAGIFALFRMHREMFPQFALDMINILVPYPGASPEEVEEGICIKIEEQIKSVEGIKRTFSTAEEGNGSVTVELVADADPAKVLDDIKTEVDRIDTFPENAEDPVVTEIVNREPAISVAIFGDASELQLRKFAEKIRDDLVDTQAISQAGLMGVRDYEISVEISEENLRRYGITFDDVVNAIKTGSVDLPGGAIKTEQGDILVRTKGQRYTGREFEDIPLITLKDGTVIRIGQVADVTDGFEDTDIETRFNGKPAAIVQVFKTDREDIIEIARVVKKYVKEKKSNFPSSVSLSTWLDLSTMVDDRINLLLRNGGQGIVLVFLILALFLNLRLAFWVALGIPISFMGAFLVLDVLGETINMISLFAFIMTLGILVDDAIIVGENIYTHYSMGKSPKDAVVDGLSEVGSPVVMAIATSVVAFVPLLFIAGIMGKFIAVMPTAVIAILIISLIEALIILPAHLHHALTRTAEKKSSRVSWHKKIRNKIDGSLNFTINKLYTPCIRYVVRNRFFTFSIGIAVLILSLGLVVGGHVPFVFHGKGESDWIIVEVVYPLGTPFEVTRGTIKALEKNVEELNAEFKSYSGKKKRLIPNAYALVGAIPRRNWKPGEYGNHCGQIWIEMISSQERNELSVNTILNRWRNMAGQIPGVERISFIVLAGGPGGNPIEVQLAGNDFDELRKAANELKEEISTFPGTFDVSDDFKPGKREYRIRVKEGAKSLGITMGDIAKQIRQAFYGDEALRIQRGKDDLKVMVRYSIQDRRRVSSIEDMRIRSRDGYEIPIHEIAEITPGKGYSAVRRVDRKRVITVVSDLDESRANASRIVADLKDNFLSDLIRRYPNIKYSLEGQEKRSKESIDSMMRGFSLALMVIFLLLASQFRSYIQPVVIMMAIPFGLVGAIAGHLIMGMEITIISLFGLVALSGIVVNDALILIDFINRAVRRGVPIDKAVIESGRSRFRPVILTSITTVAGLLPLLLEKSFQAQFLIPMAISICFGLVAATVLTLLYVPALYLIVSDVRKLFVRKSRNINQEDDKEEIGILPEQIKEMIDN